MTDSNSPAPHTHRVTLLIAVAGVLIAGYAFWRGDNTRDREDATRDRLEQLENANTTLRAELATANERETKFRADLQKQWQLLTDLPQQVKDLSASHEDLRARTERPQRAWSRAEAMYLVELAQRRLSFDHDTATAIVALESADERLASLRDASLNPVRERIAKDLQALRALPDPDRVGVMTRLLAIEAQVTRFPLKGILVGQRSAETNTDVAHSLFQRAWHSVSATLARLISVRRLNDRNGELVALEEQSLRRQHLTLLVFTARHAVMRNDRDAYRAAIDEIQTWLAQYFSESPAVDAATRELAALSEIDVAPALPDISAAAQMLARGSPAARSAP